MTISMFQKKEYQKIFEQFSKQSVLVIGDVGIDRYTIGQVERISPEAPVPVVLVKEQKNKLGLAANVVDNLWSLKAKAQMIGVMGEDGLSQELIHLLSKASRQAPQFLVTDSTRQTILKERVVSDKQQLLRVDYESSGWISKEIENKILKNVEIALKQSSGIILQDYQKGMITPRLARSIIQLAKKSKKLIAVDPHANASLESYCGADFLTPNKTEAEKLSGIKIDSESNLSKAGDKILSVTQAHYLAITRGKDGLTLFERGSKKMMTIPTVAREVFDVSGAGDTVVAVMVLSLLSGCSIKQAAILGNIAGGIVVGKRGTATVTQEELLRELALANI